MFALKVFKSDLMSVVFISSDENIFSFIFVHCIKLQLFEIFCNLFWVEVIKSEHFLIVS